MLKGFYSFLILTLLHSKIFFKFGLKVALSLLDDFGCLLPGLIDLLVSSILFLFEQVDSVA